MLVLPSALLLSPPTSLSCSQVVVLITRYSDVLSSAGSQFEATVILVAVFAVILRNWSSPVPAVIRITPGAQVFTAQLLSVSVSVLAVADSAFPESIDPVNLYD